MRPTKTTLLAVSFAAATSLAVVRPARAQSVSIGVLGGLNASTFADFRDLGPGTLRRVPGLLAGVFVEVPIGGRVSLQPELIYTQKGARVEGPALPGATTTATVSERFEYLQAPILIRFGATADRRGVYIVAGPAVAALVRAREHFDVPGVVLQDEDIKDGVTGTDVGVIAGGGFSTGRLGVEARVDVGLRNLIPPSDRRAGDPAPTNRSVSIAARLRL
jgi:outer membrane immunogenic protein